MNKTDLGITPIRDTPGSYVQAKTNLIFIAQISLTRIVVYLFQLTFIVQLHYVCTKFCDLVFCYDLEQHVLGKQVLNPPQKKNLKKIFESQIRYKLMVLNFRTFMILKVHQLCKPGRSVGICWRERAKCTLIPNESQRVDMPLRVVFQLNFLKLILWSRRQCVSHIRE